MVSHSTLSSGARLTLPKDLRKFLQPVLTKAAEASVSVYLVGGCVRDLILGRPAHDIDVVVEGPAAPLAKALAKAYKAKLVSHPQFLTHTIQFSNGRHLDIATARTETYAESAALPLVEPASLQEDLYRRDFSINAIALSLNNADFGHLWDPFGGMEDLELKKLRVLHSESFKDDPTRIFRGARFAGRFGYELDWRTREWLSEAEGLQLPAKLSAARIREELIPLVMEKDPRPAFHLLVQWGALGFLVPNFTWEKSHDQLYGQVIKKGPKDDGLLVRLLILLHTVPYSKAIGTLTALMFPQALVQQADQAMQVLARLREGTLAPTSAGSLQKKPMSPSVKWFLDRALRIRSIAPKKPLEDWQRFQDCTPCLSGRDIRDMGYKPGPVFTRIFDALRQARWEGKLRTREEEIRFLTHAFPINGA